MVGHILELLPMLDRHAAPCLFFIEKRLDQQGSRQNFVAWAVQQIGTGHMGRTHGFAFAAAQTILHAVGNGTYVRLLHDQRFMTHQTKTGCVGIGQIGGAGAADGRFPEQFAAVEITVRVHTSLVLGKGGQFCVGEVIQLGNAYAVLTGYHPVK